MAKSLTLSLVLACLRVDRKSFLVTEGALDVCLGGFQILNFKRTIILARAKHLGLRILSVIFRFTFCHCGSLVGLTFLTGYRHVVRDICLTKLGDLAKIINGHFSGTLKHSASPLITMSTIASFAWLLSLSLILLLIRFLSFLQIYFGSKASFHTLSCDLIIWIS